MNTLETAIQWREAGIACIPIRAGTKLPALMRWRPYIDRLPELDELKCWFSETGYGIAVITGHKNLVILDWDDAMAQSRWLASLDGAALPVMSTYRVLARRGTHYYFFCPNVETWKGDNLDVRSKGSYCLGPPSVHPTGHIYTSIGSINDIKTVDNIETLVPNYKRYKFNSLVSEPRDPYVEAMRHSEGTSSWAIEEAKSRIRYEDLIPSLRSRGRLRHALCPLHDDKHASFIVYPDNHYFCYGCQARGKDALDLFAQLNKLTLGEAVRKLTGKEQQ